MYILGIMGGTRVGYQDASAALLKDGKLVAFVEEERMLRMKRAAGTLPERAIRYCLGTAGINIEDVDYAISHGSTWQDDFRLTLREFFLSKFGGTPKNIEVCHHHDAHCASAFYASGFDNAMVISADYSGDGTSTEFAVGSPDGLKVVRRMDRPNSMGIFYALLTEYCGFLKDNDEYKVMGLSSYGDKDKYDFSWLLNYNDDGYTMNTEYLKGYKAGDPAPSKMVPLYNDKLLEKLGPPRNPGTPMTEHFENVAASGQRHLEDVMISLVTNFHKETGLRKLCLAGGVALNVVVNQRLMNLDFIDEIYVQPASNDGGISLGAAYWMAAQLGQTIEPLPHVYYGPGYTNDEIEDALKLAQVPYQRVEDAGAYAAQKVAQDKIVGWFQGRMEFGPRALGNRSILANPGNKDMQDIVNIKVKFREEFRPFCPSLLEEDVSTYFIGKGKTSPYMTITYDVKEEHLTTIPSVTHVDNTSRIQSVNKDTNPRFYHYLQELKNLTGHGITMNTSFNVKGDPIVNTPFNALATFYGSGMDTLVIGDYVVNKKD